MLIKADAGKDVALRHLGITCPTPASSLLHLLEHGRIAMQVNYTRFLAKVAVDSVLVSLRTNVCHINFDTGGCKDFTDLCGIWTASWNYYKPHDRYRPHLQSPARPRPSPQPHAFTKNSQLSYPRPGGRASGWRSRDGFCWAGYGWNRPL